MTLVTWEEKTICMIQHTHTHTYTPTYTHIRTHAWFIVFWSCVNDSWEPVGTARLWTCCTVVVITILLSWHSCIPTLQSLIHYIHTLNVLYVWECSRHEGGHSLGGACGNIKAFDHSLFPRQRIVSTILKTCRAGMSYLCWGGGGNTGVVVSGPSLLTCRVYRLYDGY